MNHLPYVHWAWVLGALYLGFFLGLLVTALCAAARQADDRTMTALILAAISRYHVAADKQDESTEDEQSPC